MILNTELLTKFVDLVGRKINLKVCLESCLFEISCKEVNKKTKCHDD